jgi:hypothetical protein
VRRQFAQQRLGLRHRRCDQHQISARHRRGITNLINDAKRLSALLCLSTAPHAYHLFDRICLLQGKGKRATNQTHTKDNNAIERLQGGWRSALHWR